MHGHRKETQIMRESQIEKAIRDFAKANGITMQKQSGPNDRGKADQLCMKDGVAGFLEIKRPGEKPTALQLRYLEKRSEDGFPVAWCANVADGVEWLKKTFLTPTTPLEIICRPLLVAGQLRFRKTGTPVILVDDEQDDRQKAITVWHEILHLLRMAGNHSQDENEVERDAVKLAEVFPEILVWAGVKTHA